MIANTKRLSVLRVTEHGTSETETVVVEESTLTIVFNGQELVTLLCSPRDPEYLAAGFVQSQGLVKSKDDIKNMAIEKPGVVRIETKKRVEVSPESVLTSSGGRGKGLRMPQKVNEGSQMRLSAARVFSIMNDFEQRSETFKVTGGVHSAAICDATGITVFNEDIGRHNAIDKVFGQCLLQDTAIDDSLVLTSGRVSSEILLKVATRGVPVIVSRNAPTDVAVKLANDLGMTVVGFVRGKDLTVYTNEWRIAN